MPNLDSRLCASSDRVFQISELMTLVYGRLDRSDCTRLLRTSKLLFGCVVPFVWREVVGVAHLLALIPGTEIVHRPWDRMFYDPEELETEIVIRLPKSLNLTRLRMYAPFVQALEVSELPRRFYRVEGEWSVFGPITKAGLLPNLRHLSVTSTCKFASHDDVSWMSLFLCAGLRVVRMLSWYPHRCLAFDVQQFPNFVSDIARVCTSLEILELYPTADTLHHRHESASPTVADNKQHPLINPLLYQLGHLPLFQHICQLSGSDAFLCPKTFMKLSSLPQLKELWLYGATTRNCGIKSLSILALPANVFPGLRHLELHSLTYYTTLALCALHPLVKGLTSVVVEFPSSDGTAPWDFDIRDLARTAICSLNTLAPHIADLTVQVQGCTVREQIMLDHSLVEALQGLPLRSLTLSKVALAPDMTWADVLRAIPNVETLRLGCSITHDDLSEFAEYLLRLRVLELQFIDFTGSLQKLGRSPSFKETVQSRRTIHLQGELYISNPNLGALSEAARYLTTLWPKIRYGQRDMESVCNLRAVQMMNCHMSKLQCEPGQPVGLVLV